MQHLSIDADLCIGSGKCAWNAPEIFDQDDVGTAILLHDEVDDEHQAAVQRAAKDCPAAAITLI